MKLGADVQRSRYVKSGVKTCSACIALPDFDHPNVLTHIDTHCEERHAFVMRVFGPLLRGKVNALAALALSSSVHAHVLKGL